MSSDPFDVPDKQAPGGPSSQLDLFGEAVDSEARDEFLDDVNLGLGNYGPQEFWQQVSSFSDGLYSRAAFKRVIINRATHEAKHKIALHGYSWIDQAEETRKSVQGWTELDADEREGLDKREWLRERREKYWNAMPDAVQEDALEEITGISSDWTPPFIKMMMVRHEASRSRGARLLDNLFGRAETVEHAGIEDAERDLGTKEER